ncbi:MAG: hypothetical protein HRU15_01250 [Planctomycetes bacterium]|nr:hypothetical protein [Planctomycetota bacterium]
MLILFVRILFVILTCFFGYYSVGPYFYEDHGSPHWAGAIIGFTLAITLVASEHAWRRHFNRTLMAFLIGLSIGLSISYLMIQIINEVVDKPEVSQHLAMPIALVITYLVLVSVLRNADRLRLVIPFIELRSDHIEAGSLVIDASALADSRFIHLIASNVLSQRIIVHSRVLISCEDGLRSTDDAVRVLSAKALEGLKELQDKFQERFSIDHTSIANAESVNQVLIELARLDSASICSNDHALSSMAKNNSLRCIVINELAQLLLPSITPGASISVYIEKKGDGKDQGIGHLDDGSMVIVTGAAEAVDTRITCTILRLHNTNNGRMVFAEYETSGSN